MAVPETRLDPDNDPLPIATDWQGDEIMPGEYGYVEINGEIVNLEDAVDWLVANSTPFDTEE